MDMLKILFNEILVLFIIIGFGVVMGKSGKLEGNKIDALSNLVLYLFIPLTCFNAFQIEYTVERLQGLLLTMGITAITLVLFLILAPLLIKNKAKNYRLERGAVIYSNAGNMVLPLITMVLGGEAVFYAAGFLFVYNIMFWTHLQKLLSGKNTEISIKSMLKNPTIIALVIGFVRFSLQIPIPSVISQSISAGAACLGPISMIIVGFSFSRCHLRELFSESRILLICFFRLVLFPSILVLLLYFSGIANLFPWSRIPLIVVILSCSAPANTGLTLFSSKYNLNQVYAAKLSICSMVLSIITMPLVCQIAVAIL